jgi:small ligand-binding sensory domain FIST
MKWASSLSTSSTLEAAVAEVASEVHAQLDGARADLLVVFASAQHWAAFAALPELLGAQFPGARLVGCSAGGVIGGGHEAEERPGLSLTAGVLPAVTIDARHVDGGSLPEPEETERVRELVGVEASAAPHFLLFCDPYTCDVEVLTRGLDAAYPGACKVGGLSSGTVPRGGTVLFLDGAVHGDGALVVALSGDIDVDTIVAQGCRPIGPPMPITRCEDNVIVEIAKRRPLDVLRELYETLPARDRELARHSLFVGLEMNAGNIEVKAGEFLVRNILDIEPTRGALVVGAAPAQWQVMQFFLRDATTAEEDLSRLLDRHKAKGAAPAGALLFSCLGRGVHLFGRPDHDTDLFRSRLGPVPLGGFFCNGEIGPVGGTTFLHGYTSSFGLFRPKR